MVVLMEVSRENDAEKCQRIWMVLSDLYAAKTALFELTEDRRHLHAAELLVAAWKRCQSKGTTGLSYTMPEFVSSLKTRLAQCMAESTMLTPDVRDARDNGLDSHIGPDTPQSLRFEPDVDALFDLDFQDIDWAFWNSID